LIEETQTVIDELELHKDDSQSVFRLISQVLMPVDRDETIKRLKKQKSNMEADLKKMVGMGAK